MRIAFFFECGEIDEIGTGHKYRAKEIAYKLSKTHVVSFVNDINNDAEVLVIDHMKSQKELILSAKAAGKKVVLIDGTEEDASLSDVSISAFTNRGATHTGFRYITFPTHFCPCFYSTHSDKDVVFVGMGGYDKNNYADLVLKALSTLDMKALVAKSINHPDFSKQYPNVRMFEEDNYFEAMRECTIAITNGGLTMFQALYFGIPCMPIAQYEHQKTNISYVRSFSLPAEPNEQDISEKIGWLMSNREFRNNLSALSRSFIKGTGADNICEIIEQLK